MKIVKKLLVRFDRWMSYNPPGSLSSKGWRLFNEEFKKNAPIRYWFRHDFRTSITLPIIWKYESIKNWIRYRTYDRYHVVKTGLPPGYCGADVKLLHTSFNTLKDFVEGELAWHTYIWSEERKEASFAEKYIPLYRYLKPFRSREWGIKHLDWASTLDDPTLPPSERCDHQAVSAREIRELYLWWVDIRPARKEIEAIPYGDQGLGNLSLLDDDFDRTAQDYVDYKKVLDQNEVLAQEWEEEDTQMFIRLVKVRKALWT